MEDFLTLKLSRSKSFRALKFSRLENLLTLKPKTLKENIRALKVSILEESINDRRKNLNILAEGLYFIFIITWFMGAALIILGLIKRWLTFKDPKTLQTRELHRSMQENIPTNKCPDVQYLCNYIEVHFCKILLIMFVPIITYLGNFLTITKFEGGPK